MQCPYDGCDYESSELGVQQHHKRSHGVSLTAIEVDCDECGKSFTRQRSQERHFDRSFCSGECKYEHLSEQMSKNRKGKDNPAWKNGDGVWLTVECHVCGTEHEKQRFDVKRNEHQYCSRECYSKHLSERVSGEDNFNWRGGYEPYYGENWRRKRREALERDGYECQNCGMTNDECQSHYGKSLSVHHITPIRVFDTPEDANTLDNLVTYCTVCHGLVEQNKVDVALTEG